MNLDLTTLSLREGDMRCSTMRGAFGVRRFIGAFGLVVGKCQSGTELRWIASEPPHSKCWRVLRTGSRERILFGVPGSGSAVGRHLKTLPPS